MKREPNKMMNASKAVLIFSVISVALLTAGCSKSDKTAEDTAAIRALLEKQEADKAAQAKKDKDFWEQKKKETSNRIPY